MSPQNDLTAQFLTDLTLDGCIIQAGAVDHVDILLTPENYRPYLQKNQGRDLYLLGDVSKDAGMRRAGDKDIPRKHYFFLDFDIREFYKQKDDGELSDTDVKENAVGILFSLGKHELLSRWRYAVFTGNGLHVYYIGFPVEIDSLERWRSGMQHIFILAESVAGFPPDGNCKNPSRLGRVPGSNNNKGERRIPTEMLEYKSDVFDLSLIEELGKASAKSAVPARGKEQTTIAEGSRNATLTSIAGSLRRRCLNETTLTAAMLTINKQMCNPPLKDDEVQRIAKSVSRYSPSPQTPLNQHLPSAAVIVTLSDVQAEEVRWLWRDRIPLGKLAFIEGDPGLGKSWCSLAIAHAVTRGLPLPGDEEDAEMKRTPAKVLLLTAEDGLADTIRPRLEGMGADLTLVKILTGVRDTKGEEQHLSLVHDLSAVDEALTEGGFALVVIDPLNAYLGIDLDTHKDSALRSVLTPLTRLAERRGVALICIRHLTKSAKDQAIYRGQGSIGYTAAARVVHLIGVNPHNPHERVIVCIKNNLAQLPLPLGFEVNEGRFLWSGVQEVSADDLLKAKSSGEGRSHALDEAMDFLREALAGSERDASDVKVAAKESGISEATLKRAKQKLQVVARKKDGFGAEGGWIWALPNQEQAKEINESNEAL